MSIADSSTDSVAEQAPKGKGLSLRLVSGLVLLIVLICSVSFYVIWFQGRPLLESLSEQSQAQRGQNITLALGQQLRQIEGVAKSMASMAIALPKQVETFEASFPPILNQAGVDKVIAGGGIWPEPFEFDPHVQRRSFFWGRGPRGKLRFYDDYNEASGPGYQSEEWYAPGRFLSPSAVYWSKSYTDPYSLQPMVTCAAPMIENGRFKGIATVDLKLDEVSKILEQLTHPGESYAFVVDRNNKLIAFPDPKLVLTYRKLGAKRTPDFIYLSELANKEPAYLDFAKHLDQLEYQQFKDLQTNQENPWQYVKELDLASYQIDQEEARRIAAHLWAVQNKTLSYPEEVLRFDIEKDHFLGEQATAIVFQMPRTNWKVVTVFKHSAQQAVSDAISLRLTLYLGLTIFGFGFLAYWILKTGILARIGRMTQQLQMAVESDHVEAIELDYRDSDELGTLVYWFNRRSAQVESARTQADRANKVKTDFLAKMSHEFRTPLNSIIGFSRRLIKNMGGEIEPRYLDALHAIHRSALHQLDMINDILDHNAIESGTVNLRLTHESVNEILDNVQVQNKELVSGKGLQFIVERLDNDKKLYCDTKKVEQALSNLVSNAVKATESGCIKVSADESVLMGRSAITFVVADTGIGISDEDKKGIFRPFAQVDTRMCTPGTGLGLFLARYFVDLHGGEITLRSRVQEGSEFSVVLPVAGPVSASART